jgi:hypothetical protein
MVRAVAAHLLGGGHRRLAFLSGSPDASTNIEREAGFAGYLAEQGLPPPLRECGHFAFDAAMAATRCLLLRPDRPDAIFCANDTMALAAITVARHEFGIDVGRDLSIVGYDDVPMAAWPSFALTTYSQPAAQMVDETVRLIRPARRPGTMKRWFAPESWSCAAVRARSRNDLPHRQRRLVDHRAQRETGGDLRYARHLGQLVAQEILEFAERADQHANW